MDKLSFGDIIENKSFIKDNDNKMLTQIIKLKSNNASNRIFRYIIIHKLI